MIMNDGLSTEVAVAGGYEWRALAVEAEGEVAIGWCSYDEESDG